MPQGPPPAEYYLQKYLLLLATVVATVAYAAAFNPPGGAWQVAGKQGYLGGGDDKGHLAGEPIIRSTHYLRFLVFFYCNAVEFASSIVVIIIILVLAIWHDWESTDGRNRLRRLVYGLRVAMVLDLLGLMGAYAAGTSQDEVTTKNDWVLVVVFFVFVVAHMVLWHLRGRTTSYDDDKSHRKVVIVLATFITSITYTSGLSMPGGFWDSNQGGHSAGDPILQENHRYRLRAFFFCNTTSFAMSLVIIVLLMGNKILKWKLLYPYIAVALLGLVGAYAFGSCRETDNTVYVASLLAGAFLLFLLFFWVITSCRNGKGNKHNGSPREENNNPPGLEVELSEEPQQEQDHQGNEDATRSRENNNPLGSGNGQAAAAQQGQNGDARLEQDGGQRNNNAGMAGDKKNMDRARSLVELLAILAVTVTYQAGLVPPGGVWQDNQGGHKAGDPILLSTNPKRYKVFFYCNSMAFVVSLVVIISAQFESLLTRHALEMTMMLDLFGLMGAYAAGSCRDLSTSMIIVALVGAVLVCMVMHVVYIKLDRDGNQDHGHNKVVHKRRKMLLLLAVLCTTVTYQAGLAPPGGFQQSGHHLGDPVLLHNYPRRYKTFFFSNSVTFASSIALIILLVNLNMYGPAIESYALHVCTVAGMFGLVGAFAAGSTQHLDTSIYILVLVVVVLFVVAILLVIYGCNKLDTSSNDTGENGQQSTDAQTKKKDGAKKMMMLGVLAASITYQAGLNPPGGVWQGNSGDHAAGDSVMHDNWRHRYTVFFYSNSTSFVASIAFIILLLWKKLHKNKAWLKVMKIIMMVMNLLGLLGAYAAGSTTEWETSGHVIALLVPAVFCVAVQMLPLLFNNSRKSQLGSKREFPGSSSTPIGGSQA